MQVNVTYDPESAHSAVVQALNVAVSLVSPSGPPFGAYVRETNALLGALLSHLELDDDTLALLAHRVGLTVLGFAYVSSYGLVAISDEEGEDVLDVAKRIQDAAAITFRLGDEA